MTITYGFYNSLNGDRKYSADDFSAIFNGIINDGIFQSVGTAFVVKADEGLFVDVGIGRAWFDGTYTVNDSIYKIEAPASDLLYDRIDAVVIEVDKTNRVNSIKFVQGEAKTNPVNPTLTKTTYVKQYPLCYIKRKANSESIAQADITNKVGSEDTPFVTGILKTISLDTLLGQWEDELNTFVNDKENYVDTWFANKTIEYENWVAAKQEDYDDWTDNKKSEYDTWISTNEADFLAWFERIKDTLDENIVTTLMLEIDNLFNVATSNQNGHTVFNEDGSISSTFDTYSEKITFNDDGTITTLTTCNDGKVITKTTTFNSDGSIDDNAVESYT